MLLPVVFLMVSRGIKTAKYHRHCIALGCAERGDIQGLRSALQSDPSLVGMQDKLGETLMHRAAKGGSSSSVSLLLEYKADADARDRLGRTPLNVAASYGGSAVVDVLLQHGVDVYVADKYGMTALDYAISSGCGNVAATIYKRSGREFKLHEAAARGKVSVIRQILAQDKNSIRMTDDSGRTPVYTAAALGQLDATRALIDAGSNVNVSDESGTTSLQLAVDHGSTSVARLLLARGADPDAGKCRRLSPPLLLVSMRDDLEIAKLLLHCGANPDIVDDDGNTALHKAAEFGKRDMIEMLLACGANPNFKGEDGFTPLHIAVNKRQSGIASLLMSRGADVNARLDNGKTPLMLAMQNCDRVTEKFIREQDSQE